MICLHILTFITLRTAEKRMRKFCWITRSYKFLQNMSRKFKLMAEPKPKMWTLSSSLSSSGSNFEWNLFYITSGMCKIKFSFWTKEKKQFTVYGHGSKKYTYGTNIYFGHMHYSTLESRMVEQCMQKIIGKNVYGIIVHI